MWTHELHSYAALYRGARALKVGRVLLLSLRVVNPRHHRHWLSVCGCFFSFSVLFSRLRPRRETDDTASHRANPATQYTHARTAHSQRLHKLNAAPSGIRDYFDIDLCSSSSSKRVNAFHSFTIAPARTFSFNTDLAFAMSGPPIRVITSQQATQRK